MPRKISLWSHSKNCWTEGTLSCAKKIFIWTFLFESLVDSIEFFYQCLCPRTGRHTERAITSQKEHRERSFCVFAGSISMYRASPGANSASSSTTVAHEPSPPLLSRISLARTADYPLSNYLHDNFLRDSGVSFAYRSGRIKHVVHAAT